MNNIIVRSVTGVAFVAVVAGCLLAGPVFYGALFLAIMIFSMKEFNDISLAGLFPVQRRLALVAGILSFLALLFHFMYGTDVRWCSAGLLFLLLVGISLVFADEEERKNLDKAPYVYTGLLYVALPIILSPMVVFRGGKFDGMLMLSFFILIWISDVGAYCLGTAFGQRPDSRKLSPSISPKKSWWGFWSGTVFCIIGAVALCFLGWLPFKLVHCVSLAIIISASGVCGDLFESLWKRHFGVKDSGHCIPGHGGMLDRFDSSFFAIPAACIYLVLTGLF